MKYIVIFFVFVMTIVSCKPGPKPAPENAPAGNPHAGNPHANIDMNAPGHVVFKAPEVWKSETPTNSMRKEQYRLPGSKPEDDAELVLSYFPGAGGSVDANLSRWYGQFKQPDGGDTQSKAVIKNTENNKLKITVVRVSGNYMKPRVAGQMGGPVDETPAYAMWAAIVEAPNGPWFLKAVGPQTTMDKYSKEFEQLIGTIDYILD
ncbi:MAG TPA: hypothetical protein PLH27_03475 [bacterium]|nr:hypothetical protein [bacterium]HMW33220.1 hypothetical protein [bacterium]HMW35532.1 hypothetical protein [bacterium]HMY34563.1 hypothetical protein [bacterium]HMZ04614.1 hypothetical protein [bacterium]